jgi:hypothetical protein
MIRFILCVFVVAGIFGSQAFAADTILTIRAKPGSPIFVSVLKGSTPCKTLSDGQKICGKSTPVTADIVPADGSLEVPIPNALRKSAKTFCAQNDRTGVMVCKPSDATLIKL